MRNIKCCFIILLYGVLAWGGSVELYSHANVERTPYVSRNLSDVQYLLWTRQNIESENYYVLEVGDLGNLEASPFDGSKKTYFIFHGWGGNGEEAWILNTKTSVLALEDSNIISVDYRLLVDTPNYNAAVKNMYNVANLSALYIDWIIEVSDLTTDNMHLIGHSLGGQCAGMAAQYTTAGVIDRVTGLDPAGPWFYNVTDEERIDKSDGKFVDIIHTNSCPLLHACVGFYHPTGHVDFFPNGGDHQEGCTLPGNVTGENWLDLFSGCSHARAHEYWVESILAGRPNSTDLTFVSWPCEDYATFIAGGCPDCGQGCLEMGFNVDRSLEGSYYLTTEAVLPFAKGDVQN